VAERGRPRAGGDPLSQLANGLANGAVRWAEGGRVGVVRAIPDAPPAEFGHGGVVRILLNIVWLIFGGFALVLGYLVAGVICCVFVVTIPFGVASFRIAHFALWPFGRTVVDRGGLRIGSTLGNLIWLVFAGLWITIGHLLVGTVLCVSIVGIPLGLAHYKLIPVSMMPLGKEIVHT
jgi:uncharacterized membrane protein YccF (DUF307 family)